MKSEARPEAKPSRSERPKLLSLGSTLLNLAVSGSPNGALPPGSYLFLVGDSASGKTFLSLTCLAEAMKSKAFADYRIVYGDEEGGAIMDWEKFFGKKVAERVETVHCGTVEGFYYQLDDLIREGKPFIFVEDSMDALTTGDEGTRFQELKKASRAGKEASGSYGTSKAKQNSSGIRQVLAGLRKTGSILIVISQTRDNIGWGSQYNPKTRGGGHALTFYAHCELWSSQVGQIKKTVKGKPRSLGIVSRIKVKKNRITGKLREVDVPILWQMGIDDVRSCVEYLVEEGHWAETKGVIDAKEFGFKGPVDKLIAKVEAEGLERELKATVTECWSEVEAACEQPRKSRYQ